MKNDFHVIIPARYESSRLPGKPILDIAGVPMIIRVVEQALKSGARSVVVATDDSRIEKTVAAAGHQVLITSTAHQSGTDRVAEVAEKLGWPGECAVVNVQGDEPLIPPDVISQVAGMLAANHNLEVEPSAEPSAGKEPSAGEEPSAGKERSAGKEPSANKEKEPSTEVATLFVPIQSREELFDPNVVKVVTDITGQALYFSRAPVPWSRSGFGEHGNIMNVPQEWKRHVGIYAYTVRALQHYVALPASRLERIERLEQLRMLENGVQILTELACEHVPGGVDTLEDYENICIELGGG